MPISLADFQNDRATVSVKTRLGPVEVVYRPNTWTIEKEAQIAELMAVSDDDDAAHVIAVRKQAMVDQFCEIVESIDITGPMFDEDGDEIVASGALIPVEPAYVIHLPSAFINRTFVSIRMQAEEEAEEYSKSSTNGARPGKIGSRRGSSNR